MQFLNTVKLTKLTASQRGADKQIYISYGYFTNLLMLRLELSLIRWVGVICSQMEYKIKLKDKTFIFQHIP